MDNNNTTPTAETYEEKVKEATRKANEAYFDYSAIKQGRKPGNAEQALLNAAVLDVERLICVNSAKYRK